MQVVFDAGRPCWSGVANAAGVAFRFSDNVGTSDKTHFGAQYTAYTCLCQRSTSGLTTGGV